MTEIFFDGQGGLWRVEFTTKEEQRAIDEIGTINYFVKSSSNHHQAYVVRWYQGKRLCSKAQAERVVRRVEEQIKTIKQRKLDARKERRLVRLAKRQEG